MYRVTYAEGDRDFSSFPVDETMKARPEDTYPMSKLCSENIAECMARRFGIDIYVLCIGAVIGTEDYSEAFSSYINEVDKWKAHGWLYTDARDFGHLLDRCV